MKDAIPPSCLPTHAPSTFLHLYFLKSEFPSVPFRNSSAKEIHASEHILGTGISHISGLLKALGRFGLVSRNAPSVSIHFCKRELSVGISFRGSLL